MKSTFIRNEMLEKNEKSLEYRIVIAAIQHSAISSAGHRILRWSWRENGKSSLLSVLWVPSSSDKRSDVLFLQKVLMKNETSCIRSWSILCRTNNYKCTRIYRTTYNFPLCLHWKSATFNFLCIHVAYSCAMSTNKRHHVF